VKPARLGNRHYIEDMYEHRYQRQLGPGADLPGASSPTWRRRARPLLYGLMHLAGVLDRWGMRRVADAVRRAGCRSSASSVPAGAAAASFRFVVTGIGGCALDVDNEHDLDVARLRFSAWERELTRLAESQQGPLPLPAEAGAGTAACRVLPPGPPAT
jgi:hypothetical protein